MSRSPCLAFLLLLLVACDKPAPATGSITPPSDPPPVAPPPVVASTPAAIATAPPPRAPVAVAVAPPDAATSKAGGAALKPASKHVTGKHYALDLGSSGCRAGDECVMTIKIATGGEFHVNKEYPYKFIAAPRPGVAFLGKSDPNLFTRSAGDFVEQGEKAGTMTVRFKSAAPGDTTVAGKYKLSVCSADQCQIEEEMLELTVPVL